MKKRQLQRGELTRIIIGTVVAAGDDGINAAELAGRLNGWGIEVTKAQMNVRLYELAKAGRIDRLEKGRYTGV